MTDQLSFELCTFSIQTFLVLTETDLVWRTTKVHPLQQVIHVHDFKTYSTIQTEQLLKWLQMFFMKFPLHYDDMNVPWLSWSNVAFIQFFWYTSTYVMFCNLITYCMILYLCFSTFFLSASYYPSCKFRQQKHAMFIEAFRGDLWWLIQPRC